MNSKNEISNVCCFAAANGYGGFRSYFNEVFSPHAHDRVYIIKGGAGTGKSSLMKKVVQNFADGEVSKELIYCSSDASSLDGVILKANNRSVAILDGTAPHQTDAKMPGLKDEFINLASNLDTKILKRSSDEIITLMAEKARQYKRAYQILALAGNVREHILRLLCPYVDEQRAASLISDNLQSAKASLPRVECARDGNRLFNSFAREGEYTLTDKNERGWNVKIKRMMGVEYRVMDIVRQRLCDINCPCVRYPDVFSDKYTHTLYLNTTDTLLSIDASEGIDLLPSLVRIDAEDYQEAERLERWHAELLRMAAQAFKNASTAHFAIEKHYISAMDFSKNEAVSAQLCNQIGAILSL